MTENLEHYVEEFGVSILELHLLNIQRLGLATNLDSEMVKLRVLFDVGEDTFHKPVINNPLSSYKLTKDNICYRGQPIPITVKNIEEDSAEPYYFRGDKVLVINSTVFDFCDQGCIFCEVNSAPEDKRRYCLVMPESDLFDLVMEQRQLFSLKQLSQISIITSCTGSENRSLELVGRYQREATKRGFEGDILFATNEIRSFEGIQRLATYENIILAFTVECFTNRRAVMPGKKGAISLPEIKKILQETKKAGIVSTYFYIFGIDDLSSMEDGFRLFKDAITVAPTGPNYQPQGRHSIELDIKPLRYFLEARRVYINIHRGMEQFEACQNYRSLWPTDRSTTRYIIDKND